MIERGEIWWALLPDPRGSEPGFKRPVVVVQSDLFNRSAVKTVLAVILTSNLARAGAPGNVTLPSRTTGLPRDSVATVTQLVTIDKSFMEQKVGQLGRPAMRKIDDGLRVALDL